MGATLKRMSNAFDTAKAGGKNHGLDLTHRRLSDDELSRSIRSFDKQIEKHRIWISDPESKIPDFMTFDPRRRIALLKGWDQDIARHAESIDIVRGILKERGR